MNYSKVRVVLFDLDNTLYSYLDCHYKALNEVNEKFCKRLQLSNSEFEVEFEKGISFLQGSLGFVTAAKNRALAFQKVFEFQNVEYGSLPYLCEDHYWNYFFEHSRLFDGVLSFLEKYESKLEFGIVSDYALNIQLAKLYNFKIDKYFKSITTSEELGVEKPDVSIFKAALKKHEVSSGEVIFVGDNLRKDVVGCNKLDIRCYVPEWSVNSLEYKGETRFQYISSFDELSGIVSHLI